MEKTKFILFLRILFVILLAFFLLSILPILILGFYSVPAADDYSYGYAVYHAVQSGASLPGILSAAFHNIEYTARLIKEPPYHVSSGRYRGFGFVIELLFIF